jgi:hypothetical protein
MTEHHGEDAGRIANRPFREVVQVRAADADGMDTDLNLSRTRSRRGRGFCNRETVLRNELGETHEKAIPKFF